MLGSPSVFGGTDGSSNTAFSTEAVGMTTSLGSFAERSLFGGTGTSTAVFGATLPSSWSAPTLSLELLQSCWCISSNTVISVNIWNFNCPFGANQPSSSGTSASVFGTSTSVFGSNPPTSSGTSAPIFGISTGAFGANQASSSGTSATIFGTSTSAFGATLPSSSGAFASIFGNSTGVFGADPSYTSAATKSIFGTAVAPSNAFPTPTFQGSSSSFGAFGQKSTSDFGYSSVLGRADSATSNPSTPKSSSIISFGPSTGGYQNSAPLFIGYKNPSNGQHVKSKAAPYVFSDTFDVKGEHERFHSVSSMPVYENKSHEELRWNDYQLKHKGGFYPTSSRPLTHSFTLTSKTPASNALVSAYSFPQPSFTGSQFTSPTFVGSVLASAAGLHPFDGQHAESKAAPYVFFDRFDVKGEGERFHSISAKPLYENKSHEELRWNDYQLKHKGGGLFPTSSQPSTHSLTLNSKILASNAPPGIISSQPTGLGHVGNGFSSAMNQLSATSVSINPSTLATSSPVSSSPFSLPCTTWNFSTGSGQSNISHLYTLLCACLHGPHSILSQHSLNQIIIISLAAGNCKLHLFCDLRSDDIQQDAFPVSRNVADNIIAVGDPFGTQTAVSQPSVGNSMSASSIQHGISSIPVHDKPASVPTSFLLATRHILQRSMVAHPRKYQPKRDGLMVRIVRMLRFMALIVVLLFLPPMHISGTRDKTSTQSTASTNVCETAEVETSRPGSCNHVKDFVVGGHGYGSIKFEDIRGLDLDSVVHFNNCAVIVYADMTNKPPVGQGLNRPAEVTLLTIKCINKKTGVEDTSGLNVEKCMGLLKKKTVQRGAELGLSFKAVSLFCQYCDLGHVT
ncbi:hypothetical protein Ancab_019299 [Ancistrocladus abbreviatus]